MHFECPSLLHNKEASTLTMTESEAPLNLSLHVHRNVVHQTNGLHLWNLDDFQHGLHCARPSLWHKWNIHSLSMN